MCGLLGYIGASKDIIKTEKLITCLFEKTQIRGVDASGYYCVSDFDENKIYYHKQPGPSINLIEEKNYKDLWKNKTNLGLFHCRAASTGVGIPQLNQNNHPFVSHDFAKAVIHNGLIVKHELAALKKNYEMTSDCDSEIILRVLEQNNNSCIENLSFLLSMIQDSHFSVAYSENNFDERRLFLFRNKHRPLYFADLIDELGQIIFFSTIEIFLSSIELARLQNIKIQPQRIIEIQPYEIYEFISRKNQDISINLFYGEKGNDDLILEDNFYPIQKDKKTEFDIDTKLLNNNILENDLLKIIDEMQSLQIELSVKVLAFKKNKKPDQESYDNITKYLKEINKKLNYIITTI